MKPEMVRRQQALEKTMTRFAGKTQKLGTADCIQLVRAHLRNMGHRKIPATGQYGTPAGAVRALKKTGFDTFEALFDSLLPRIAPAAMLAGDIALVEAAPDETAIGGGTMVISVGRKFIGWHPSQPELAVIEPTVEQPFIAAWRA